MTQETWEKQDNSIPPEDPNPSITEFSEAKKIIKYWMKISEVYRKNWWLVSKNYNQQMNLIQKKKPGT